MYQNHSISVVIPAFNEAASIGTVIYELSSLTNTHGQVVIDEIVVCDNASTDRTAEISRAAGAVVVAEATKGYGSACLTAIDHLKLRDWVIFVDADRSVKTQEVLKLLDALHEEADLVVGSRRLGQIEPGAMSLHQFLGTALASALIRLIWQQPVTDLGPFRAIHWHALQKLNMQDTAYGWTAEMQIKALKMRMKLVELPVTTLPRIGQSKISGTLRGSLGAFRGIYGTILRQWLWR